jgi:ribosomal 30S subunit maturation factor RimM
LGEVTGWLEAGGPPLLEVSRPGRREPLLVPFAAGMLARVDLAGKRLEVDLPDGLKELNAE